MEVADMYMSNFLQIHELEENGIYLNKSQTGEIIDKL